MNEFMIHLQRLFWEALDKRKGLPRQSLIDTLFADGGDTILYEIAQCDIWTHEQVGTIGILPLSPLLFEDLSEPVTRSSISIYVSSLASDGIRKYGCLLELVEIGVARLFHQYGGSVSYPNWIAGRCHDKTIYHMDGKNLHEDLSSLDPVRGVIPKYALVRLGKVAGYYGP